MPKQVFTEADFDSMSWHDNHIHAVRFVEGEHGGGDLELDLDHIVEWLESKGTGFQFRVVPATLTFHEVMFPKISIDYGAASAAFGPIMIDGIERPEPAKWKVVCSFPPGEMEFSARGFTQKARGQPVLSSSQSLNPADRGRAP